MMLKYLRGWAGCMALLWALLAALPAAAQDPGEADPARIAQDIQRISATIQLLFPDMGAFDVIPTAMPDIYEVTVPGGDQFYAHRDGLHFMVGELFQARGNGFVNLTEQKMDRRRRKEVLELPDRDMIIFPAKDEKASVVIFTDVTCTYCRKIHREVPELNELGITVRYLAYPRGGTKSRAYRMMVSAWCADAGQRQEVLTRLKQGEPVEDRQCDNPISDQYALGNRVGVRGTPAIVLESGQLVPGYLPAAELAERAIRASGR